MQAVRPKWIALAVLLVTGCASQPGTAPLPPDTAVLAPDPSVPADVRALSGKWSGKWRGLTGGVQQDTVLVVEWISTSQAAVIHSQGDHPRFRSVQVRTDAKIEPRKSTFNLTPARGPIVYIPIW
ncbi:hypothetical protein QTH97_34305 [Variovorax sp. J22R24]|uniref:hypothetical protein n=1 Tax=Variovorax gracilis TaxID=3053502 RepID=UPI002574AF42|nr:hypothetical protein [Variovorax sp. J22R24]MDM0110021.1 hypothetical protein [Variovorax sp. J22R24]